MRNIVINWLSEVMGRNKSQFKYASDQELFELLLEEYYNSCYENIKYRLKEENKIKAFAKALDSTPKRFF